MFYLTFQTVPRSCSCVASVAAGLGQSSTEDRLWLHILKVLPSESSHHWLTSRPERISETSCPSMRYPMASGCLMKAVSANMGALPMLLNIVLNPVCPVVHWFILTFSNHLCLVFWQSGVVGFFQFNSSPQPPGYVTYLSSALQTLRRGKSLTS